MRYKKSEISAAHIIEAATRVMARQGYAHTSLMDIAKEAGMSKGAVHYHFPTKEALTAVVLQSACDAVATRTRQAWTEGESPFEALQSSLRELWRVRQERTDEATVVADLLAQSVHDDKLRAPLAAYYRFATGQVQEHLAQHLSSLGLRPRVPAEALSRVLHAILDGLTMQLLVDPEAFDLDTIMQTLLTLASSLFEVAPSDGS
jgi:AcrR family transcriptional regulator